ncbi:hypothetical protein Cob_v001624 [Colletotrichum orbiculare MAFF 240422]|uniref:Uncharacterized protein n=1 Tax=Colletotrichum orbiculare (strain 104-T / ATCC 96160 / CBS 514.97 / LARS 414 / MAFF 240422) TaxID=1213857 RepID=A0A484G6V1_COLOR|nr:hypothetical protein Cob_v001624 [Colletotrichum orbiculare MAFF 240422]
MHPSDCRWRHPVLVDDSVRAYVGLRELYRHAASNAERAVLHRPQSERRRDEADGASVPCPRPMGIWAKELKT